jgi:hypothetical protein
LTKNPKTKKHGTVTRVIKSPIPQIPEKAEIDVKDADPLYKEIRVENTLENEHGQKVKLKPGAEVEITIEADSKQTASKSDD